MKRPVRNIGRTRLVLLIVLITILSAAPTAFCADSLTPVLQAIRQVESRGDDGAVGDGGKAIGPYQIWRAYWQDAVEFDPSIGGVYEDCFDPVYAEKVVRAYMKRYAPKNATPEQIARIHNGGPSIFKKKNSTKAKDVKAWNNTTAYWNKVKRHL